MQHRGWESQYIGMEYFWMVFNIMMVYHSLRNVQSHLEPRLGKDNYFIYISTWSAYTATKTILKGSLFLLIG